MEITIVLVILFAACVPVVQRMVRGVHSALSAPSGGNMCASGCGSCGPKCDSPMEATELVLIGKPGSVAMAPQ